MREVILFIRKQINFIINDQKYFILVSLLSGILQCYERIFMLFDPFLLDKEIWVIYFVMTCVKCLFNAIHIYLFTLVFYIFFRRKFIALVISQVFFTLLLMVNFFKIKYLSMPLNPTDIFLLPEAIKSSPFYLVILFSFLSAFFFISSIYLIYRTYKYKLADIFYPSFISMIAILYILIPAYAVNHHPTLCAKGKGPVSDGCFILTFIPDTRIWFNDRYKSKEYGFFMYYFAKTLDSIVQSINKKEIPYNEISKIIKKDSFVYDNKNYPNIIIIMDESFTDPRKIDKRFNQYDFSFIDTYKKTNFISPTFGGGTANVEFEVLTGLNIRFLSGEPAYTLKIKQETYSLPYYLKSLKYQTVVIHNNNKGFYNRDIVYPKLGFSEFISLENMPYIEDNKKIWASDELIFDNLREALTDKSESAKFIYAITVENHPFYNDNRYGEQSFDLPQNINEEDRSEINTYSAGVILQNKRLNAFVDYLKTIKRPTLLLVFGDHQPLMNFTNERDPEKTSLDSFKTPLMVWSNYDVDLTELNKPYIAASFLAPKLLKMANIPLPNYFKFIEQVSECYDVIHTNFILEKERCSNEKREKLLKNYQDLNIDVLNGKNYTYSILAN